MLAGGSCVGHVGLPLSIDMEIFSWMDGSITTTGVSNCLNLYPSKTNIKTLNFSHYKLLKKSSETQV